LAESGDAFRVAPSLPTAIVGVGGVAVATLEDGEEEKALRRPWALGAEATRRNCLLKTEVGE